MEAVQFLLHDASSRGGMQRPVLFRIMQRYNPQLLTTDIYTYTAANMYSRCHIELAQLVHGTVTMRLDTEPAVLLHARHAAERVKHELEYSVSRVLDNVASSVRSANGLFLLQDIARVDHFKAHLMQHTAERITDDIFAAVPLAKMSARRDKAPPVSDAVPGNRSVSDVDCTLASVRQPLSSVSLLHRNSSDIFPV